MSEIPIVAVVDDDEMVGEATAQLIETFGLVARIFSSAEAYLKSNCFDETSCIVSDVQMPRIDGLQLQQRLIKLGHDIPVIFVTAFANERVHRRAMKAGAVCFLMKPFEPSRLLDCLRSAIGRWAPEPAA